MTDQPTAPADSDRAAYAENLRARRVKAEPFVYPCRNSQNRIKFALPLTLPFEAGETVLQWMYMLDAGDELGMAANAGRALRAWVGDEGYDLMVRQDKLTFDEVAIVMADAGRSYQQVTGGPGESPASTS